MTHPSFFTPPCWYSASHVEHAAVDCNFALPRYWPSMKNKHKSSSLSLCRKVSSPICITVTLKTWLVWIVQQASCRMSGQILKHSKSSCPCGFCWWLCCRWLLYLARVLTAWDVSGLVLFDRCMRELTRLGYFYTRSLSKASSSVAEEWPHCGVFTVLQAVIS